MNWKPLCQHAQGPANYLVDRCISLKCKAARITHPNFPASVVAIHLSELEFHRRWYRALRMGLFYSNAMFDADH